MNVHLQVCILNSMYLEERERERERGREKERKERDPSYQTSFKLTENFNCHMNYDDGNLDFLLWYESDKQIKPIGLPATNNTMKPLRDEVASDIDRVINLVGLSLFEPAHCGLLGSRGTKVMGWNRLKLIFRELRVGWTPISLWTNQYTMYVICSRRIQ